MHHTCVYGFVCLCVRATCGVETVRVVVVVAAVAAAVSLQRWRTGAELRGAGRAGRGSAPVGGANAAVAGQWHATSAVGEIRQARTPRPTRRPRR